MSSSTIRTQSVRNETHDLQLFFDRIARLARPLLAVLLLIGGLTLTSNSAFGQASSSSDAVGRVTDSSGATVPGATIHLINNATGAERTATTNDSGDWSIPNIPPRTTRSASRSRASG